MIVDSSALIAILNVESDAVDYATALHAAPTAVIGAPTLLETSIVARVRGLGGVAELVERSGIEVVVFSQEHVAAAREADRRFGRGSGSKAKLNFGDCMSYALAKVRDEPLLFKGDDFRHTDITPAI